ACSELLDNPNLRPVVVSQGALGRGLPKRNLRVSKQHRFLVSSPICKRMFGADATLVSAIQLTQLPGIFIDTKINDLRYFHILLQNHEIVFAEGAPTESLHLGKGTLEALPQETVKEITSIFPTF
ncbi:MAG: hemolysin, partial [Planktomarina temperata]|nr:hemolysin [Planktomarina temperata]